MPRVFRVKYKKGTNFVLEKPGDAKPVPKKVKKFVKRAIASNVEDKFAFNDFASADVAINSGTTYLVSHGASMIQGVGQLNRLGDMIRLKHLEVRMQVSCKTVAAPGIIRVILLRVKSPEGTVFSPSDLQINTAGTGACRPFKPDYKATLEVLYDRTFTFESTYNLMIKIRKKLNKKVTYYPASVAGTIADIKTNAYYILTQTQPAIVGGATETRVDDLQSRVIWEDA